MKYPIDDDLKMAKIKVSIAIQKAKAPELKQRVDYYTIRNPVYNQDHVQMFFKNEEQIMTKIVAEHFYNIPDIENLIKENYLTIKKNLIWHISGWVMSIAFFSIILGVTFKYLEYKSLSMIPLLSLIIITISMMFFLINYMRLRMINKVINGTFTLDKRLLKLFVFKLDRLQKDETNDGLQFECTQLVNEYRAAH